MSAWERSFVPRGLRDLVATAENPEKGIGNALVASTSVLHERSAPPATGGSVRAGRHFSLALGISLGLLFAASGVAARRASGESRLIGRLAGLALLPTAAVFGLIGAVLLPVSTWTNGAIWADNQNALLFIPIDLILLTPALRWIRSGRASFGRWTRIYLDLRLSLIAVCLLRVLGPQDNLVFAIAVGCAVIGLRTHPTSSAESRSAGRALAACCTVRLP